jgi:hypothetical protein
MDKVNYLDRPGRGKGPNGATRKKPSIMDRIVNARSRGAKAVADYIFGRRSQILCHFEDEPERLTSSEWAILRRLIRELKDRRAAKELDQRKRTEKITEERSIAIERQFEKKNELCALIRASKNPADTAARTDLTISELRGYGLSSSEHRDVGAIRRRAMRMTAAAAYLDVPKSRLETWCKEGLITCSFTRKMRVAGAGTVDARHFLPEDLDNIDPEKIDHRRKLLMNKKPLKLV